MKRIVAFLLIAVFSITAFAACSSGTQSSQDSQQSSQGGEQSESQSSGTNFDTSNAISVVSREDGSGTRGAFIELFGIEQEDENGEKVDYTTEEAIFINSTSVMMTTVGGNEYAIGYVSLGSLNDTANIKALKIDGAEATVENIKNGTYKVARPFHIATKEGLSEVAQDFINFILSAEGQAVIEENGYISEGNTGSYQTSGQSGKITIAGSSSVTPVMEKLKEAYIVLNPDVSVDIQQNDSTTGMNSAIEGICDIGMASRDLKDSEIEKGLTATKIAIDGIAVIVNNGNPINELSSEQVKSIFTGEAATWGDVAQ